MIQHLKLSLSSALQFFPPLAGRLTVVEHQDGTTSFSIECNNVGALFVHSIAKTTTVADIHEPAYVPPIVHSFFPLNGVKNYEGKTNPLLAVQVTELVDGVFIGCTVNHAAADGTSFWHFFNSWSEISRGLNQISKLPSLQRWFPDNVTPPIRIPSSFPNGDHNEKHHRHNRERVFHFSKEKIAELKAKANEEISARSESKTVTISSLQSVLAHLWRSMIRSQHLEPQQEVNYRIVMGTRSRLRPPLPDGYFGNALVGELVTMKAGEVLESGLGKVAWEMNKAIASSPDEKIKSDEGSWFKNPVLLTERGLTAGFALISSSSPRFDVYGNDFGWGRPVAVRSGSANKSYRKITVFAGAEEGSIDIEVCLPHQLLEAIGNDRGFMEYAK